MPRRRRASSKDTAKLAKRMSRRWRVVLLRNKGEILGEVEGADVAQPRQPRRSSLIWTSSSATGSWCRSWAEWFPAGSTSVSPSEAPESEAEHFIRCPACDGWIDCRDLGHVFEHEGPLPHPAQDRVQ
jgi:hypothetical protein